MIINRTQPVQPTAKINPQVDQKQNVSPRSVQQDQVEVRANNSYATSDPFLQQIRTIAQYAPQPNQMFESLRTENNRVRTGVEGRVTELRKDTQYTQVFERDQDPNARLNAPRGALELPPNENLFFGREEEA